MKIEPLIWMFFGVAFFSLGLLVGYGMCEDKQNRRKAPEIIKCKDCKHYEWMSNRIPEEQTWHCHCWDADTRKDDFCSYAERRTE